jgi:hypothetical protein
MTDNKAVSEVIGFVLVLGIVFASIGIVYFNAIPALEVTENQEHTKNAERVFSVLQYNINDIAEKEVPERSTEMRMKGGTLTTVDGVTTINVTIENGSSGVEYNTSDGDLGGPIGTNRISYETPAAKVAYENGAVFRTSDDGETAGMISEPNWRIEDEGPIIISQVAILGASTVSGDGVSGITSEAFRKLGNFTQEDPSNEIEIRMDSTYAGAWERYFVRQDGIDSSDVTRPTGNKVNVEIDAAGQKIVYSETEVSVEIS